MLVTITDIHTHTHTCTHCVTKTPALTQTKVSLESFCFTLNNFKSNTRELDL